MSDYVTFFETGPGIQVPLRIREQIAELCSHEYKTLNWYRRGTVPPLLQQMDGGQNGAIVCVMSDGRVLAAHGYVTMDTKIRLVSWGPVVSPERPELAGEAIRAALLRGQELGKERSVLVLLGDVDGADAGRFIEQHECCGMQTIMTRLDMKVSLVKLSLKEPALPAGIGWRQVTEASLDDFLRLYGSIFSTSDSPLARSWSQNIEQRRWWFSELMNGEEEEVLPGGWLVLTIDGEPSGILIMTKESRSIAQINDLGLVPSARGRGLGWLLLRKSAGLARESGLSELRLGVEIQNKTAISLYEAAGFRPVSRKTVLIKYYSQ